MSVRPAGHCSGLLEFPFHLSMTGTDLHDVGCRRSLGHSLHVTAPCGVGERRVDGELMRFHESSRGAPGPGDESRH